MMDEHPAELLRTANLWMERHDGFVRKTGGGKVVEVHLPPPGDHAWRDEDVRVIVVDTSAIELLAQRMGRVNREQVAVYLHATLYLFDFFHPHDFMPSEGRSATASAAAVSKLARAYSDAFWTALAGLHAHGISDVHAGHAQRLWAKLALAEPPQPDISIDEGVKFSWFGPRYYLEVEVMEDGRVTWYFRDTTLSPGQSEGDVEEPVAHLPARFWECLALAGAEHGGR